MNLNIFLILVVLLFHNIECRCSAKPKCPETLIIGDLTPLKRDFIVRMWTSNIVPQLTLNAQKLKETILFHSNTDSPTFLHMLYIHAFYTSAVFSGLSEYPSLCFAANNINNTVNWKLNNNGKAMAETLYKRTAVLYPFCMYMKYHSLTEIKCKDVPSPLQVYSNCYKRGTVYEILKALKLFGQLLPCRVARFLMNLYESKEYVDNIIAVMFVKSIVQRSNDPLNMLSQNLLIEWGNFIINNNASACCCAVRAARIDKICNYLNRTFASAVQHVIDTIYLTPEC